MSQFHKEEEHSTTFALLFDSHDGIEQKFLQKTKDYPYTLIKDKEERRISSMLDTAGQMGKQFMTLQMSAVSAICMANSYDEAVLIEAGLLPLIPSGVGICLTCLAKAIATCEENLIVLKDLQEAVKGYTK